MPRNTPAALGTAWAIALVMLGCGGRRESLDTTAAFGDTAVVDSGDVDAAAQTTVRVADITGNPQRYADQTVTVVADVEEVLAPFAFALDEDSPVAGGIDNDLIVAYPQSASLAAIDDRWLDNKVRVTGTVRRLTIVELERELGRNLTTELEAEVRTRPILVARSVERVTAP